MRKVEFQRYQIRRRRQLKAVLARYIDRSHQYLKNYEENLEFCIDDSKISIVTQLIRSFDELKQYLGYNGESIISEDSNFNHEILITFLNLCVEKYLNDEEYIDMCDGIEPEESVYVHKDESGKVIGKYTFGFRTVKEALENDETIDLEGRDGLKRLLFKEDILQDQAFINNLSKYAKLDKIKNTYQLVEELFEIIEKDIYPLYTYIDSDDIRDILVKLTMDRNAMRGYFDGSISHVFPKKNIHRNFVVINKSKV